MFLVNKSDIKFNEISTLKKLFEISYPLFLFVYTR